ncbi:Uncharacterised protein [Chlamydia trachomatis]|nr:Uncharacterised protein [Chlamydia trachomatis]
MSIEPVGELGIYLLLNEGTCLGVAELRLRLTFELRFGQLDRNDGCQTFAHVIAGQVVVLLFDDSPVATVAVHNSCQRRAEAFFVHTAFGRVNRIRESVDAGRVGRGPLHRDLDAHRAFIVFRFEVDDVIVNRFDLLR